MLGKHAATLDDPASKLEVVLGSFGQRTRIIEIQDMTDIKPTDYFVIVTILDLEVIVMNRKSTLSGAILVTKLLRGSLTELDCSSSGMIFRNCRSSEPSFELRFESFESRNCQGSCRPSSVGHVAQEAI